MERIDAQWDFFRATHSPLIGEELYDTAMQMMAESPGYSHYYLTGWNTVLGNKVAAVEHFILLATTDPDRFRLFLQDPDMLFFFDGVGTEHFYAVPMKDEF